MVAGTASLFLLFSVFMSASGDKIITAEPGQDVTLTCRAPNNNIIAVKWNRTFLGDECVLLYWDGHFVPDNQHPFFKNRVDLQDRQMKDGDMSLILKDVTIFDSGTYECGVQMKETHSWERSFIYLSVLSPYQKNLTAESGQDLTLTCRAVKNIIITGVKWGRDDLGDEYVLLYQDEQFDPDDQHPSFKNRVDLQDRQMKDGDVSLILKDVMINDTGTYECCVFMAGTNSWKLINITYLIVVPPPAHICLSH
ncbi:matrix remodeling-associated protein 8-like isoform X2 [Oreochromis aureus]|uniref:matrix remodeling-associated protein 8-like isoform X2 n=1 Tax=Oreochromis aureus TaxID=47969 RepID=UPI001954A402|nr:matrix remodeling-associated protein 8-like isoform X2 [Oreochromis aureus]